MIFPSAIRFPLAAALLWAAGCAAPPPLRQTPLAQGELDTFLASGRDARELGITIYPASAGARFEFANRPHMSRTAQLDFLPPKGDPRPVVEAETPLSGKFPLLLDSSARQSWATMASIQGLEYRLFKPPAGEYADHVAADVPGYVGAGNKLILDELHVESPIYYVLPARGGLGPLARVGENPETAPKARKAAEKAARRMPVVAGAGLMKSFAFIRFDFPARSVVFSTSGTYRPANPDAVHACLPLLDWMGRPAVEGALDGFPLFLVIDTAGDFDVSLHAAAAGDLALSIPAARPRAHADLALGGLSIPAVRPRAHADLGLPETLPGRLGLGVLSRYAIVLDFKQQRVWFEGKTLPGAEKSATSSGDETAGGEAPVHYRGITR